MKHYKVIVHYRDKVCVVEAGSEMEALEKAEQHAFAGAEIHGMEVIDAVKK